VLGRRYTIERELGRGGMATVYLAFDKKHGRRVALKVLPPELAAALGPERFLREIAIAAKLSHPHILPLHDSGQAAGMLYYVMPHVDGESLRERLTRERQLPLEDAVAIARDVAGALSYAHAIGVVHRDVKPENILLAGDHALLADFGIARAIGGLTRRDDSGAELRLTDSGLPIGTAAYASPEQAAGKREVDGRSDVYSLGCVLFEMLVGDPPQGGTSAQDLLEGRFAESLPSVRAYRPSAPAWVDKTIATAVASNPADRFPTAARFRDALTPGSAVAEPPSVRRPPRRLRQVRLLWMAGGAAILALVGTAVAFLPRRVVTFDPKRIVVAAFENRTGDSALASVSDIAADYIARGLAATGLMHEVYDARATAREVGQPVPTGAPGGLSLARRVGAGTVLSGSYYLVADSLHFEAQLLDGRTGQLIVPLQPSVGLIRERTRVVEQLRQRVMAGLSMVLGSEFDTWQAASLPPTYEAYQEMLAAKRTGFEFAEAAEHLARAAALDTTFTGAQTARAVMLWLSNNCEAVDSIVRRLEPKRHLLPAADLSQLDLAAASCHNDTDAALSAVRQALEAVPRSRYFAILGSVIALEHLRPEESLEILKQLDVDKLGFSDDPLYHDWLGMTYHMLGDYQNELAVSGHPAALVALGRVAEAEEAAARGLPAQHTGNDPWPAPMASECVALELQAHGHPDAARRVRERIIAWYGEAINDATRDDNPCMAAYFSAFYYTGRWDAARAGYEHRLAEDSTSIKAHAALGALAVRRGDKAEADRMEAWLAARGGPVPSRARARMAALRGDRQRAVDLLREAFEQRLAGRMFLHLDPDFESLRDFPAYRELLGPELKP
jgi:tRNA A-37 threonylcarbamoyl transferase component Bud32/tetratricopeptide (TPR) repeat protein